jgi:hypothetical protein
MDEEFKNYLGTRGITENDYRTLNAEFRAQLAIAFDQRRGTIGHCFFSVLSMCFDVIRII